jgi:hypothetical protein
MKKTLATLLTLSCLSLSSLAFATHPLVTDDTGTNGMLKFQVETSAEFGWDKETINNMINTKAQSQILNIGITAGLLDSLDLALAFPFTWQQVKKNGIKTYDNGGINDLSLALKWRFLEIGPASLAIKPSITFPSGDYNRGLGAARPAYGVTMISTVEFKPVALHANVGYTQQKYTDVDKIGRRENLWNVSAAGEVEAMHGVKMVAEIGTVTNGDRTSKTWPMFMTGGLVYSVIDNLDLSLGVKGALTRPETDFSLLTGVTFKLP